MNKPATQRVIEINSPFFIHEKDYPKGTDLASFFPNSQPLCFEIGSGIGDFIVQMATRHPERNFIAVDIFNKGCYRTCRQLELANLQNVRVMRCEARYLLFHNIKKESLQAVYINCPDPWPKTKQKKRRLVNPELLNLLHFSLKTGGDFFFTTDFEDYGLQVAEFMPQIPGYRNEFDTPYNCQLGDYPTSKYMRRFLKLGQPIYFIHYRKTVPNTLEAYPVPDSGFRNRWSREEIER